MGDLLELQAKLESAFVELCGAIKLHNSEDWSNKTLWEDKWVDEVTVPARKQIVAALRAIVTVQKLYQWGFKEAADSDKDYS